MRLLTFISIILLSTSCKQTPQEKPMSAEEKLSLQLGNAVLWFQNSAEMEASYLQAYARGKQLLISKLDTLQSTDLKPAVILDLDETVLDNSPYEARLLLEGKNYESESWKEWCMEGKAEALPGSADFLWFADSLGIEIFYVSNRKINVFESTLQNLKTLKLPQAEKDHIYLRTTKSDKTERRELIQAGHQVLLYVGDNLTDYKQIFADKGVQERKELVKELETELLHNFIMLPNPMYGDWESAIYDNNFTQSPAEKNDKRAAILDAAR